MTALTHVLLVAAGGLAGAIARWSLSAAISRRFPSLLPYGTLTINALGSFLLGIIAGHGTPDAAKLLLGTGFMGAFTTFSTFKLESFKLAKQRAWRYVALYVFLSYTLGIMLAVLGFYM